MDHLSDHIAEFVEKMSQDQARRVADQILDMVRAGLREMERSAPEGQTGTVMGLDPYALYSVSFVAKRFGMTPAAVRRISDDDLPRAAWRGSEIRFRGRDVLIFEGVEVEEDKIVRLPDAPIRRPPRAERQGRRIKATDLPPID